MEGITDRQKVSGVAGVGLDGTKGDEDELFEEAKEIIVKAGKASTSMLQRRLSIGYGRAAKILDMLEDSGIIGPPNGSKPREVLISQNELNSQGISSVPVHDRTQMSAPENYFGEDEEEGDDGSLDFSNGEDEEDVQDEDEDKQESEEEEEDEVFEDEEDLKLTEEEEEEAIEDEDEILEEIKDDADKQKEEKPKKKKEENTKQPENKTPIDEDDEMFFAR
jgi:hypothetical protein